MGGGGLTPEKVLGALRCSCSCPAPYSKRCLGDRGGTWLYRSWNAGYVPVPGAPVLGSRPLLFSPWGQVLGRQEGTEGLLPGQGALLLVGTKATPVRGESPRPGLQASGITTSSFP